MKNHHLVDISQMSIGTALSPGYQFADDHIFQPRYPNFKGDLFGFGYWTTNFGLEGGLVT